MATHNQEVFEKVLRKGAKAQERLTSVPEGIKLVFVHHLQSDFRVLFDNVLTITNNNERLAFQWIAVVLDECLNHSYVEVQALIRGRMQWVLDNNERLRDK